MPRILKTRQSREDYISIEDFIARESPQNAEMVIQLFEQKLRLLANNNHLGWPRFELAPNLRSWRVYSYVLFYRPIEDGVILIRILHASMDITPRFFPDRV